ncbi:hypothetical protein HQ585_02925 [candidate division KSB1 bacterium]|nr:hypothetical protein [candidate division KSB1 bacterium]
MRVKAIVLVLFVVMVAGSVLGQSSTVITIGGNYWRGSSDFYMGDEEISKAANMIGPYLSMRFGNITLGGSVFWGTWDLSDDFADEMGDAFDNVVVKDKRQDMNFSLGYSISKNLSIFGAYKSLKIENEIAFDVTGYYYNYYNGYWGYIDDSYDETTEETYKFMGGGASMLFPFTNSPLFLYGSLSYLFAQDEDIKDLFGYTFGAGMFSKSGLTLMVGYRAETFKADDEIEGSEDWKINGITATLAYTIR